VYLAIPDLNARHLSGLKTAVFRSWKIAGRIERRNADLRLRLQLSWWGFLKSLYKKYEDHAVADSAAALGYYFVFSLFPFLFFLATLTAFIPHVRASLDTLMESARAFLPSDAIGIIEPHLRGLVASSRPHLLTLGLALALYSASRGVNSVRWALNRAYDVTESRPLWKTELLAFGMTIGGGLLLLVGIAVLVLGGSAGQWAARHLFIADQYVTVLRWIRWPITIFAIMLVAALSYHLLPDVEQKFKFITPGSVIGTVVWFPASWCFGIYVSHFGSYNVTYGSIGGVVVLLTWFYITAFILLMGGEMNAIIEDASPDGKESGARAPNQAPPPPEERPSAMPAGAADSASVAERSHGGKSRRS
jgi:membrane protein